MVNIHVTARKKCIHMPTISREKCRSAFIIIFFFSNDNNNNEKKTLISDQWTSIHWIPMEIGKLRYLLLSTSESTID